MTETSPDISIASSRTALRRLLTGTTALCTGVGVAVGTGIFRTPGEVAHELGSAGWIIAAWMCGGVFTLAAGLVTAELATRFPRAGGEYVYLREAYGDFAAFFFGWAYTVFGIGGGAATMAAGLGEAACELLDAAPTWAPAIGVVAIVLVTLLNCLGVRMGAGMQTALTIIKVAALLGITAFAFLWPLGGGAVETAGHVVKTTNAAVRASPGVMAFAAAFVNVSWAYSGSTDSARLAEEVRDVHRALPRALIGSALALTAVYVLVNLSFLRVMTPSEMGASAFVGNDVMRRLAGPNGGRVLAGITVLVCFGTLASTILASVRITFALARDGLAPGALGRMSSGQAPITALVLSAIIAIAFVFNRGFTAVLAIYSLATAILFSMTYVSLLVFRGRESPGGPAYFRCPAAALVVVGLLVAEVLIVISIARSARADSLLTLGVLAAVAALYPLWRALKARRSALG